MSPGQRFGTFELIGSLGAGGMGEVWSARDLTLDRMVALKFLRVDLTRDTERLDRFRLEARAASALNHPNVCTIHGLSETADGQNCIVLEYVRGETLRERLVRGPIPLLEGIGIAVQVAAALNAAHAAGIVHGISSPRT